MEKANLKKHTGGRPGCPPGFIPPILNGIKIIQVEIYGGRHGKGRKRRALIAYPKCKHEGWVLLSHLVKSPPERCGDCNHTSPPTRFPPRLSPGVTVGNFTVISNGIWVPNPKPRKFDGHYRYLVRDDRCSHERYVHDWNRSRFKGVHAVCGCPVRYINNQGYAYWYWTAPNGNGKVQVAEHRIIMEQSIGRELRQDENVHHINGVRDANRIENLELWITSQPSGQRVEDVVAWARQILVIYSTEKS